MPVARGRWRHHAWPRRPALPEPPLPPIFRRSGHPLIPPYPRPSSTHTRQPSTELPPVPLRPVVSSSSPARFCLTLAEVSWPPVSGSMQRVLGNRLTRQIFFGRMKNRKCVHIYTVLLSPIVVFLHITMLISYLSSIFSLQRVYFSLETFSAHSRVGRLSFDITNSPFTLAYNFGIVLPNCYRTVLLYVIFCSHHNHGRLTPS